MLVFTKRNVLLYFRDKISVFFSMLAVLILVGLYVFFRRFNVKRTSRVPV